MDEGRSGLDEGPECVFTLPPDPLLVAAASADWPPTRIYALVVEGEQQWRDALGRAVPSERAILACELGASWVSSELLVTEPARARLCGWFARGRPVATPERVTITGDDSLYALARRALARLPAPVLDHVRRNAILLPLGRSCSGFCVTLPAAAADATEARRLLVCNYSTGPDAERAFGGIVAHEVAHHWLSPAPSADFQPRSEAEIAEAADDRSRLVWCAREWNMLPELFRPRERDERQACALAASWGFAQSAEACAWNARRAVLAEAEAATLPPLGAPEERP